MENNSVLEYNHYLELAEQNDVDACWHVGHMLLEGIGVPQNAEQAVFWFARGKELGDGYCMTELGRCYSLGLGVEKDLKRGFWLYSDAAQSGDALAYANLGYCYETGQGCVKRLVEAIRNYRHGASMGEEHCINALARLLPPTQREEDIFLGLVHEINEDYYRIVNTILQCIEDIGLDKGWCSTPDWSISGYTTAILHMTIREDKYSEYIRIEHRISDIVVPHRLNKEQILGMFTDLRQGPGRYSYQPYIGDEYVSMNIKAMRKNDALQGYLEIIRKIGEARMISNN